MPELPEVETVARDLDPELRNTRIVATQVFRPDVLRLLGPAAFARTLTGGEITRTWRRAKHVVMDLDGGHRLVTSLRFTGAWLWHEGAWSGKRHDYTVLALSLSNGRTLRYRDVRRLGTVTLMTGEQFARWEATIGPEPLERRFDARRFRDAIAGTRRAIKTVLMDQKRIAGVGNIYANEALWNARIRPDRSASSLGERESAALHAAVKSILASAVKQRGTSFRDYRDPQGRRGGFLGLAKVYERGGEPCVRCGTTLRTTHKLENRITVWCPACQA